MESNNLFTTNMLELWIKGKIKTNNGVIIKKKNISNS